MPTEPSSLIPPSGMPDASVPSAGPSPKENTPSDAAMSVTEHLTELRRRMIYCVATLALCVLAAFLLAIPVIDLFKLSAPHDVHFVQLSPGEVLMASCKIAVILGVSMAFPVLLYHFLRFIMPGLNPKERKYVFGAITGGTGLFLAGCAFAYFVVLPPTLSWLMDYGREVAENQMSIAKFVEFCTALILLTGLMFELPMVLFMLSFTGLVSSKMLWSQWRWATVSIFVVAAIVTPSQDPLSMTLVGLAMVALYLLSIIPIKLIGR